ncbi:MAG: DUF1003 domain-containing protein [Ignavibacteria bacterium]|jgi:uncharacterized membrane protein
MIHKNIHTLEELKKLRKPVRNVHKEQVENLTGLEKLAMWVTDHVGTMGFFIVVFAWTILWLGWNSLAPKEFLFDPFPAFVFWLFISNMIQLFLMPLIMVGQNLQGRHSEARAQSDFEVNLKAEREIEVIIEHLENQSIALKKIVSHLGIEIENAGK